MIQYCMALDMKEQKNDKRICLFAPNDLVLMKNEMCCSTCRCHLYVCCKTDKVVQVFKETCFNCMLWIVTDKNMFGNN